MEPGDALAVLETSLRAIVRTQLGDLWQTRDGAPDLEPLRERAAADARARRGTVIQDDLLNYANFYDLKSLIEKNWESFAKVFEKKRRTEEFLDLVGHYRNAIAHSRELLSFERDLLAGISGMLRNQVTLYRGKMHDAASYYPTFERAVDHFGHAGAVEDKGGVPVLARLDIGDVVAFEVRASDPRGREIEWALARNMQRLHTFETVAVGNDATIRWEVTEEFVGESVEMVVAMRSVGARFHKYPWTVIFGLPCDELALWRYAVNPPLD